MKRILLAFFLITLLCVSACAAEIPNVLMVIRNSQALPVALKTFTQKFGAHACRCDVMTEEQVTPERLSQARVLFLEHPTAPFLERYKDTALRLVQAGRMKVLTDVPEVVHRGWEMEPSLELSRRLLPYWHYGGEENLLAFLMAVWKEAGGPANVTVPAPVVVAIQGAYHPEAPKLFPNLREYLTWYRASHAGRGALAVVGFYPSNVKNRDLEAVDALIRSLEKRGLAAAAVSGWPNHTLSDVFQTPSGDPVRVFLLFTLSLGKPEDAAFLEKQNVHVVNLMVTRDSYEVWEKAERGVTAERVDSLLAQPERNGATEPILVATTEPGPNGGPSRTVPIPERVDMAAARAARWVTLAQKPHFEKRVVMLYYNNPPGKGNVGASYLNVPPSIRAVLKTLHDAGYRTGERLPETQDLLDQLERVGRNVENWAPGELNRMVEQGGLTLLSVRQYREWFDQLPERFRQSVNERWGPPEAATLMTLESKDGEKYFVIPGVRLGNVFLGPQLLRSSFAEYTNVQHSSTLPPHHGYVASYLWYRHQFQADAIVHMGRHGTLEWLPGKNAGQAGWDCSEVILGDLPNVNYYIMDGGGEAVQARRRGAAVDLSHLTPMLARTGLEARFQPLRDAIEQWTGTRDTSPLLAQQYADRMMTEAKRLGLREQLKLEALSSEEALKKIETFADSLEEQLIPLGLPTLGEMPPVDRQRDALAAYLGSGFSPEEGKRLRAQIEDWATVIAVQGGKPDLTTVADSTLREKAGRVVDGAFDWLARLRASPDRELAMLPRVLRGEFLPSGPVGDPIAVPDGLPSGRNLHQGDPALIPTKAAWEVGRKLAEQLLADQKKRKGHYPERISMVLWSGETGRHQGAMEAQALYLMGVQPEWNARGVVDRLRLMTDAEMAGRPRVNVLFTVSGLYRDSFADKILMLDRAARLAASAGDNAVSRASREVEAALRANGVSAEEAQEMAGARVFGTAPGAYGFGLQQMVEQSRDQEEPQTMTQLYLSKMNYAFTQKSWGAHVPHLLQNQLRGNEAIVHSRSSNLYGAVDNDDVYQYMGGLRMASESVGAKPELMMHNMRRPGHEHLETAKDFIATELNARNWNPKWIAEMQKEGYSGAREMVRSTEFLYGWQATAPETVAPEMWKKMYDVYVADEYSLGMKQFFSKANPAARQNLIGRLLEVDRQGTWRFSEAERSTMLKEFVTLTSQRGVTCSANMCGNRKLRAAIVAEAKKQVQAGKISQASFDKMSAEFKQAIDSPKAASTTNPARESRREISHGLPTHVQGHRVLYVDMATVAGTVKQFVIVNAAWLWAAWLASVLVGGVLSSISRRLGRGSYPTLFDHRR